MNSVPSDIRLMGRVTPENRNALRRTMLDAGNRFDYYRRLFDRLGVSRDDILSRDPFSILQMLPLQEGAALEGLAEESVRVCDGIVDIETSSGTTGPRKRRFISHADDVSETEFLAELFGFVGISRGDRVACLDTDPLTLMVSFTKAFDLMGIEEAYSYCVGVEFSGSLSLLRKLDPTVLVSIPSIIEKSVDSLERDFVKASNPNLRKLVYVGERLDQGLRARLESRLGLEVFGYYGASETSALGIECGAHDGIHLFTDRNVIEFMPESPGSTTGEIVVTTLRQEALPLFRYALGDVITVKNDDCPCGSYYPRVEVLGRVGETFSILGAKLYYEPVLATVYRDSDAPGPMQIVLERHESEKLTIVLPREQSDRESSLRKSLLRDHPDLDFLTGSGYLSLDLRFEDEKFFSSGRKQKRLLDLRHDQNTESAPARSGEQR